MGASGDLLRRRRRTPGVGEAVTDRGVDAGALVADRARELDERL
jgi:hypothetical protein